MSNLNEINSAVSTFDSYIKLSEQIDIPPVPWEIFEFLQQEQNREHSRFLINNNEIFSWVYDCLLGQKDSINAKFPLSESDHLSIQKISPLFYQRLENWIVSLRTALQMDAHTIISDNDFSFDCLIGKYQPTNENFVKALYSMNYFCSSDYDNGTAPTSKAIVTVDNSPLSKPFYVSVNNELDKKSTFLDLRENYWLKFVKENPSKSLTKTNPWDKNLFQYASEKQTVLPLVNSFIFDVPETLKKYMFGTMMLSAYGKQFPCMNNFPDTKDLFRHYEELPLQFISTNNTVRSFALDKDRSLIEIKTDQEALNLIIQGNIPDGMHLRFRPGIQKKETESQKSNEEELLETQAPRPRPRMR